MSLFKKKNAIEELVEENEPAIVEENEPQKPKKRKFVNLAKRKYGAYALAISAIVIAVAVAINLLYSVVAARVNLDIDISLKGDNTLTEENIEFLKTIDVPVTITVCASRDSYINDLDYYTGKRFGVSESGTAYYEQTIRFLELYTKYSDNIKVEYIDLQAPESAELIQKYSSYDINYGDFVVTAEHIVDGKTTTRDAVVSYDDIYYLYDPYTEYYGYSMGSYVVSGNYIERELSGAIRKVAASETVKVGVVGTHCTPSNVTYYTDMLKLNNYEIVEINDTIIKEISQELSLLIIAAPREDFAVSELEAIDTWLYNSGNRGRGVIFFASATTPAVPNLYNYLDEWGITVESGLLFDTNDQSHLTDDPFTMLYMASAQDDELVKTVTEGTTGYIAGTAVSLSASFESDGTVSTYIPVVTYSEDVYVAPIGSSASWKPDSDDKADSRPGVIVSKDEDYVDNEPCASYVVAFATPAFVSQNIAESFDIDNMYLALNAANLATGAEDNAFSFYMKSFDAETYVVTEGGAKAITYIFQWGIPVLLIVVGVIVFIRRRRK